MGRKISWLTALLLASLLVFSSFATVVRATEDSEEDDDADVAADVVQSDASQVIPTEDDDSAVPDATALTAAPGVETVYVFPKSLKKLPVIPAGETTEVVVGISNTGDSALSLMGIRGSLHYPVDWRIIIQNFTGLEVNSTVAPGTTASFAYSFTPERLLQPQDLGVSATVYYTVGGEPHASIFFNSTVEIVEPRGSISGESVFLALLGLGLLGALAYWGSAQVQKLSKKTRRPKKVETGTTATDVSANEWLQGTSLTQKPSRIRSIKKKKAT
eukprot:jgi/Mesen1/5535/ME000280S04653